MKPADVVIVGGGVIGLSIAYALSKEGMRAVLLDRGELGREASWAGAGIIAPLSEKKAANPLAALRAESARIYPEWSAALQSETGIDNGYRRTGGIDVGFTAQDGEALRAAAGQWREEGVAFERLAAVDLRRIEPALSEAVEVAYFLPDRAQIRNPRHLKALAAAASNRGAILKPGTPALRLVAESGQVRGVETLDGSIPAQWVIVAAGPWSGALLDGLNLHITTPPVKGQIVLLSSPRRPLSRIIEHGKNYLVPRDDGRILIGATEENAGFDTRSTPTGVRDLLDEALRLCPVLAEAAIERTWAGLRPGSIDSRPYLGPAPGYANLVIATGHKRAGLQLSPATAEVVTDLILGRPPGIDLGPFRPDRPPAANPATELGFRS